MVKINKSPLPPDLEVLLKKQANPRHYSDGPVFDLLVSDCNHKCYICEDNESHLVVEHIKHHGGNKDLEFDWNNLLTACEHCNRVKGTAYDGIINCTEEDPENHIELSIPVIDLKMRVVVKQISDSNEAKVTQELIDQVYNTESTAQRREYTPKLRSRALKELNRLKQELANYSDEPDIHLREAFRQSIGALLLRSTPFAAIKRSFLRNKPIYLHQCEDYLS